MNPSGLVLTSVNFTVPDAIMILGIILLLGMSAFFLQVKLLFLQLTFCT